jgi:hypothetical protein
MSCLFECFLLFPCIKLLLWFNILLQPLMLCWILSYCVSSCLSSSSCDYVDVSSIIPVFCINPLYIMVVLFPLFLDLSQECWKVFCIMVCCATVHTCHWWKWTFPCIMSWMLEVVGRRPSQEKRLFLGRESRREERTVGRKRNMCEGSMNDMHARKT